MKPAPRGFGAGLDYERVPLDPLQDSGEDDQREDVERPDDTDGLNFLLQSRHVIDPEGDDEEGQIAEEEDEPRRAAIPPWPVPGQRADGEIGRASCRERV